MSLNDTPSYTWDRPKYIDETVPYKLDWTELLNGQEIIEGSVIALPLEAGDMTATVVNTQANITTVMLAGGTGGKSNSRVHFTAETALGPISFSVGIRLLAP